MENRLHLSHRNYNWHTNYTRREIAITCNIRMYMVEVKFETTLCFLRTYSVLYIHPLLENFTSNKDIIYHMAYIVVDFR